MNTRTQIAVVLMILVSLWFGFQAWFVQLAVRASSPLAFNAERFMAASIILGAVCFFRRVRFSRRAIRGGLLLGIIFTAAIGSETQSLALGSAGRAGFLGSLYVALLPLFAVLFRTDKLHLSTFVGGALVLLGGGVLLYTPDSNVASDTFAIIRALSYGGYLLLLRNYAREDWRTMAFVSSIIVAVLSTGLAVGTHQARFSISLEVLIPVIASAGLGTVTCISMCLWSGRHLNASVMGITNFLESPFTVVWGILLGRELLSTTSVIAFVIITFGAVLALTNSSLRLPAIRISVRLAAQSPAPQS